MAAQVYKIGNNIMRAAGGGGALGQNFSTLPALTVRQFTAYASFVVDGGGSGAFSQDWSCGQTRLVYDPTTGDILLFAWTSANNAIVLYSTQDYGATWSLVASNASNASGSQPNQVMSAAMDSNGRVHLLSFSSSNHLTYITRISLTRSGNHVTNFSIDQSALQLTSRSPSNVTDPRGDIKIVTMNGVEVCMWLYQITTNGTDFKVYAGKMSALTGTASSQGIDGTGTDTLVYSANNADRTNHAMQALLVQEGTSEHVYVPIGHLNADYATGGGSSAFDLIAVQLTKGSGSWSVGGSTTICSGSAGSVEPELMAVSGCAGKAVVLYQHPVNGVSLGYFDSSGTYHDQYVTSPLSTASRAGMGAVKVSDDGTKLWVYAKIFSANAGAPVDGGVYAQHNGTSWRTTTDSSGTNAEAIAQCSNWPSGLMALLVEGSVQSQAAVQLRLGAVYGN